MAFDGGYFIFSLHSFSLFEQDEESVWGNDCGQGRSSAGILCGLLNLLNDED
ncbi:MAG TPA: hypothetical protein HPP79_13540 [Gammaproteobacteria bacterium]|jgi:hypothetical protein|nr:hypothetical protein [Gammaproteobacteria bacterium]HIJ28377.1 hypothetical protein [Gammaproteobacteria bacterium]HIJ49434.1 hypothetical protein [Gammaproteobacteria bacterium]